jgi:hypothetical protein
MGFTAIDDAALVIEEEEEEEEAAAAGRSRRPAGTGTISLNLRVLRGW